MTKKALTRAEVTALADELERMLATIEDGEIDATTAMRHRIEGALAVLDVVLGRSPRASFGLADSRGRPSGQDSEDAPGER